MIGEFRKRGEIWGNKPLEWLLKSDLIIYWRTLPGEGGLPVPVAQFAVVGGVAEESRVDIPKSSKKLPLLLARLAVVFQLFDPQLDQIEECSFLRDELNGIRIKPELENHNTTLEEAAGLLYLIEQGRKISVIIGEETPGEELSQLFKFLVAVGLAQGEIGVFSKLNLEKFNDFSFCEE
ncbi:MAG: hypothetical protein ABGW77_06810 [Campylobacterales bacterium]